MTNPPELFNGLKTHEDQHYSLPTKKAANF